jgi:hypothetical protein
MWSREVCGHPGPSQRGWGGVVYVDNQYFARAIFVLGERCGESRMCELRLALKRWTWTWWCSRMDARRGCGSGPSLTPSQSLTHDIAARAPSRRHRRRRPHSLQSQIETFTVRRVLSMLYLDIQCLYSPIADHVPSIHNGTAPLHHRLRPQEVCRCLRKRDQERPMGTIVCSPFPTNAASVLTGKQRGMAIHGPIHTLQPLQGLFPRSRNCNSRLCRIFGG